MVGPLVEVTGACMLPSGGDGYTMLCEVINLPVAAAGYLVEVGLDAGGRRVTQVVDAGDGSAYYTAGWWPMPPLRGRA